MLLIRETFSRSFTMTPAIAHHTIPHIPLDGLLDRFPAIEVEDAAIHGDMASALASVAGRASGDRPIAVVVVETKFPDDVQRVIDKQMVQVTELKAKVHELTCPDPATGTDSWLARMHEDVIQRTKEIKAKHKTCSNCESKLSVAHIKSLECPMCGFSFLMTQTDTDRIRARENKINKAKSELLTAEAMVQAIEMTRGKDRIEVGRWWLIVGVAAPQEAEATVAVVAPEEVEPAVAVAAPEDDPLAEAVPELEPVRAEAADDLAEDTVEG
jgi:predicted RNA-binding Zn-ribbon protein involved in translation (DUF1610 family)